MANLHSSSNYNLHSTGFDFRITTMKTLLIVNLYNKWTHEH